MHLSRNDIGKASNTSVPRRLASFVERRFGIPGGGFLPVKNCGVNSISIDPHHGLAELALLEQGDGQGMPNRMGYDSWSSSTSRACRQFGI